MMVLSTTSAQMSLHQNHRERHQKQQQQQQQDDCGAQRAQRRHLSALARDNKSSRGARLASSCMSVAAPAGRSNKLVLVSCWCASILLAASLAAAYPSGAPETACKDLRPGHGAEPQTSASPFELTQDKLQVAAGEQIKVTLSSPSGTNFKGLIVQANNEAGEPKGKFLPGTGLKALDSCSAVTHSDKEAKKTATLVWQAPDDLKAKEAFVFKATVVKKFDEIYMNIKSTMKTK